MVFLVDLQMLGEMADALGEQRNLDLGRTRVRVVQPVFFDNRLRVFHAEVSFEKESADERPAESVTRKRDSPTAD